MLMVKLVGEELKFWSAWGVPTNVREMDASEWLELAAAYAAKQPGGKIAVTSSGWMSWRKDGPIREILASNASDLDAIRKIATRLNAEFRRQIGCEA